MSADIEIAIIGAGPYGLSLAAFLRKTGKNFRIFGTPMQTWLTQMPKGMHLKSEGFASSLYDPADAYPIAAYCRETGTPYSDVGKPVPLETFTAYGLEFQRRLVPNLENRIVTALEKCAAGFRLQLDNGEATIARKVVVAVGISHYGYVPPQLASLPRELVTHTSDHSDLSGFRGREVTVLGAGSSAVDMAALLHEAGASVQLVARKSAITFHLPPGKLPRPWRARVSAPMTGLGPGWRSFFCTEGPLLFRKFPEAFRMKVVRKHLGPAPGWFMKDKVVGKFPLHFNHSLTEAKAESGKALLRFALPGGGESTIRTGHVMAGTGYRVDLRRLAFLRPSLLQEISVAEYTPRLSANFESSVPGLYFVGASSANAFGPLVRFAYGAKFTSRRLAAHLAREKFSLALTESELAGAA